MKLVRRNSAFPVFPSVMDRFFDDDLFNLFETGGRSERSWVPAVNVKESDQEYQLDVVAPGMKKDDFKIELENGVLTISSKQEERKEDKDEKGNFTRREFYHRSFNRSFRLPEDEIKEDNIKAKYEDGILKIELPKKEKAEVKASKMIEIA